MIYKKRKAAKHDFEADYKSECIIRCLENYGECKEQNGIAANQAKPTKAINWFCRLKFTDSTFCVGLHMLDMKKETVYDKPVYVGTSVLGLSKLCMMVPWCIRSSTTTYTNGSSTTSNISIYQVPYRRI